MSIKKISQDGACVNIKIRKRLLGVLCAVAVGSLLAACNDGGGDWAEVTQGVVIRNATIVDTRDGSLMPGKTIVVDGGKIKTITSDPVLTAGTAQVVDALGKYVVPGFVDMHAHVVETADLQPTFFPLLIANGITAFREESTTDANIARGKQVNADSAAGRIDAPEVIFDGVEEHLDPAESAFDASNRGIPSVDHLGAGIGLIMDCSTQAQSIRADFLVQSFKPVPPPPPPFSLSNFILNPRAYDGAQNAPFYQRVLDTYDEALCKSLSQTFVRNNTWQTPTLIRLRTQDWGDDPVYTQAPDLVYVAKSRLALWQQTADQFSTMPVTAVETLHDYYELQKRVTLLMKRNGVKMLAGSDVGGAWVVPGFSLQQEFHELAAAGLSPLEVLQTTTLNPAEFLKRQASMGTVEVGKNADLVLLDANPIDGVDNLGKISGVILKGRYFSKTALDKLKSDVAAAYAS